MNYLFFDFELANCFKNDKKICSFGYLLTDESFKVIESADILMNPESDWDKYALKNVIKYPKEAFLASPSFPIYYEKIKELFESSIAIGHSTKFDVQALNDTCKRYNLDALSFSYLDIAIIFKEIYKEKNIRGLEKLAEYYGVENQDKKHTSLQDARITKEVFLRILDGRDLNTLLEELKIDYFKN